MIHMGYEQLSNSLYLENFIPLLKKIKNTNYRKNIIKHVS